MILSRVKWIFLFFPLASPVSVLAESGFSIYFGRAFTLPGEVVLKKTNGDRLSFGDIQFSDRSFKAPIYYGIRITHWLESEQQGIALDFTHAKMYADLDRNVRVRGEVEGQVVDRVERLRNTFQDLSLSHGHNFLTINLLRRSDQTRDGFVYAGAGVGLAVPHIEVSMDTDKLDNYLLSGPMFQTFLGASSTGDIPLFMEYKLSYGFLQARMPSGSKVEFRPATHHLVSGVGSARD